MIKYRAEIDGLRTVAVIPVILFHLGYSFVEGGFYGVDVFFVISGYLITKILINDIESGNFSMYRFWLRRVKRLLPLLVTVVLVTLIITSLFIFRPVVKDISYDVFPALFSYFNYHALYDFGNYWGGKAEQSFFLHTWSLSVEEQFYLVYPIFLFLVHKYFKNFFIPILTITIISFFFFFFYIKINKDIDTAFYLLPTRIWELSIGGLSGLISFRNFGDLSYKKTKNFLPIVGIFLITFSYLLGNRTLWILPVIGSTLIIYYCTTSDFVGRILSTKVFVFVGKISYSLYLWHWVIIVLFRNLKYQFQGVNPHFLNVLIVLLTFLLSYLSYHFIENKMRNYNRTPQIVLIGITFIIGFTFYLQSHFYKGSYESRYNQQISYLKYYDISPSLTGINTFLNTNPLGYNCVFVERLQKFKDAYRNEGIITNEKNGTPQIMLFGDSHGVMWAKSLNEIADKLGVTLSSYTSNASNPFFNIVHINSQNESINYTRTQRIEYAKSVIQNLEKWKPKLVIIVCNWSRTDEVVEMKSQLNELIPYLEERSIKVLLFTQPPILNFIGNQNTAQYFTYLGIEPISGYNLVGVNNSSVEENNNYIKLLATKFNNVSIYDVYENMMINNKVRCSLGNEVLYFDDDHLSYYGTYIHKDSILVKISSIMNYNNKTKINTADNNCNP